MYIVKKLSDTEDIEKALALAEEVFMEFDAPHFPKKGVKSFKSFLWGEQIREMLSDGSMAVWGCFSGGRLAGMLALRESRHISLAFVRGDFHRQGIGRMLYAEAVKYASARGVLSLTVNASDYGIPFYRAMGFKETDMQQETDGVVYTPMKCDLEDRE